MNDGNMDSYLHDQCELTVRTTPDNNADHRGPRGKESASHSPLKSESLVPFETYVVDAFAREVVTALKERYEVNCRTQTIAEKIGTLSPCWDGRHPELMWTKINGKEGVVIEDKETKRRYTARVEGRKIDNFSIARREVLRAEFLRFVRDGEGTGPGLFTCACCRHMMGVYMQCTFKAWKYGSDMLPGLKWINTGVFEPTQGREVTNPELANALKTKLEFTQDEWNAFGVVNLGKDDFIKSGQFYFKQDDLLLRQLITTAPGTDVKMLALNRIGVDQNYLEITEANFIHAMVYEVEITAATDLVGDKKPLPPSRSPSPPLPQPRSQYIAIDQDLLVFLQQHSLYQFVETLVRYGVHNIRRLQKMRRDDVLGINLPPPVTQVLMDALEAIDQKRRMDIEKRAQDAADLAHSAWTMEALPASRVLWFLGNVKEIQHAIAAKNTLSAIARTMKAHVGSAVVQEYGCRALRNLAVDCDSQIANDGGDGTIEFQWADFCRRDRVPQSDVVLTESEQNDGWLCSPCQLKGKIAVVKRGSGSLKHEVERAVAAGALGLIIINTNDDLIALALDDYVAEVPVVMIKATDADGLLASGHSCSLAKTSTDVQAQLARMQAAVDESIRVVISGMTIHRKSLEVQTQGLRTLRSLAIHTRHKATIVDRGGIAAIITAIGEHLGCKQLQEHGRVVLLMLLPMQERCYIEYHWQTAPSCTDPYLPNPFLHPLMTMSIEILLGAMGTNRSSVGVQKQGCFALGNLAKNAHNQVAIVSKGGIEMILEAMANHRKSRGVQEQGCIVLKNLSLDSIPNQNAIAAKGGIQAVLEAMEEHYQSFSVQKEGCIALRNLSWNNYENLKAISAHGCTVAAAMSYHSHSVQEVGFGIFKSLVDDFGTTIVDQEATKAIVAGMRMHPDTVGLQEVGCEILAKLSSRERNKVSIVTERGIEAVVHAMQKHCQSTRTQEAACRFLANLAEGSIDNQTVIARNGGIESTIQAISSHQSGESKEESSAQRNARVQEAGCQALINIGMSLRRHRARIRISNGKHHVEAAMNAPMATAKTKDLGRGLLKMLEASAHEKEGDRDEMKMLESLDDVCHIRQLQDNYLKSLSQLTNSTSA
jgi:hypothetical protein